jgi:phytoene dehydrogenase-like protein
MAGPMAEADVVVLGAGTNGLTAAALLARAGLQVLVLEANATIGGAVRTGEVTLPGFRHDLYSGFYPLFPVGPIGQLPLERYGLTLCQFDHPYGGATPDGPGVSQATTSEASVASFEAAAAGDGAGYRELWDWWQWGGKAFLDLLFHPLGDPRGILPGLPLLRAPRRVLEFSQLMVSSGRTVAGQTFRGTDAQVWFVGSTLHSDLAPEATGGGAFALSLMGLGQQVGMPIPRGGAQAIPDALRAYLQALGCPTLTSQEARAIVVRGGRAVAVRTTTDEFVARRAVLATVEPQRLFLDLVGAGHLPADFVRLVRRFRRGMGTFKLDCALSGRPVFRAPGLRDTGVFHLAESVEMMSANVNQAERGLLPAHPLIIGGIHTLADPTRAPAGQHTLWIETHVPHRIQGDGARTIAATTWAEAREPFADRVLAEMERYAPGLGALVLGRYAQSPQDLEASNANLVAGDISTGSYTLDQQLVFRPVPGWFQHRTPVHGLYVSGAATHPGGGVHGAAGANAARVLLGDLRVKRATEAVADGLDTLATRVRRLLERR